MKPLKRRCVMDANDREERKSFLALTKAHLSGNDLPAALNLAQARLERRPGDPDARMTLCRISLRQGRIDEARAMLEEMEESIAGLSEIYAGMGDACLEKGTREAAERYFRKCLLFNPDAQLAGEVLEKLGKIEEQRETAAAEKEKTAPIPSAFQTVTLAELYLRQGHLRPAEEVLEAILQREPQQERAAAMLREVREMIRREEAAQSVAPVIAELSRWLENICRSSGHGA
jgi:tetratricopeptide (TPR) repeat protein